VTAPLWASAAAVKQKKIPNLRIVPPGMLQ
jgi:hypothetical protein